VLGAGYPETGNANQSGLHWDMVVDLRKGGSWRLMGRRSASTANSYTKTSRKRDR
jgi:aminopeptidase